MNKTFTTPLSGRLLRSSLTTFTMGCPLVRTDMSPPFGSLVRIGQDDDTIYGIVYNITIEPDGLVRQLATSDEVDDQVVEDARKNRINPLEVSVLTVGYKTSGEVRQLLPHHPPVSLDAIYPCTPREVKAFTDAGANYLRHILFSADANVGELLAAHLSLVNDARQEMGCDSSWMDASVDKVIDMLRTDFALLSRVLYALAATGLFQDDPEDYFVSLVSQEF